MTAKRAACFLAQHRVLYGALTLVRAAVRGSGQERGKMWNQREIRQKPAKPSVEEAELLAIQAVEWLLGDEEISMRFLALSGMTADMLAGAVAAQDHEFLGGVLDFVLNNEPDLVAFAQAREMAPERVVTLRRLLGGAQDWG